MSTKLRQLTFKQLNWGGKRRGAGRKPKNGRAGVSHDKRPELNRNHPLLVTVKVLPVVGKLRNQLVLALFRRLVERMNAKDVVQVIEFSIQHDHVHMVVEAEGKAELSSAMNGLASSFARGINKLWKRRGDVFLDRYHSMAIDTPSAMRSVLRYVLP